LIQIDTVSFLYSKNVDNHEKNGFLCEIKKDFGENPFFHWIFWYS